MPRYIPRFKPFSQSEAWLLFRLGAFGEAIGWTLLIIGIGCERYLPNHSHIPVLLAGRIHGALFMLYALASLGLATSLDWKAPRTLLATAASVPPYGSLLFERWEAKRRERIGAHRANAGVVRVIIRHKHKIVAVQLGQGITWQLPQTQIKAGETAHQAATRLITQGLGFKVKAYQIQNQKQKDIFQLNVLSAAMLPDFTPYIRQMPTIEDIRLLVPSHIAELANKII